MSFKEDLLRLSVQIGERKRHISNEETTKHSLIIPFIQVLGYDVFNPLEVQPEYVADFGKKKGEKVDYAIFKNGNPILFIESKSVNENLENHNAQLSRYFNSTPNVKIGILTNGVQYKFFTDLNQNNIMDSAPFFELDITDLKDSEIEALSRFKKDVFENENLIKYAEELVYMANLNNTLKELFKNPSDEFIRFLIKDFSETRITSNVIERFKPLVKKAIQSALLEIISQGILKNVEDDLNKTESETVKPIEQESVEEAAHNEMEKKHIFTSEDEIKTFEYIKSILQNAKKDISKIGYKDTTTYFAVYKKNINGWFLRFNIDGSFKYVVSRLTLDEANILANGLHSEAAPKGMGESRLILSTIDDIKKIDKYIVRSFEILED
ncbi:type I restriction endonuclease [Candidatus Formimonas warabiya]|uniref:DNA polymerase III subunit epsilon n=1 Tax=Formimonas warabiya TaxID=1761012 RepID=A0A3G1KNR3_FORW1|nr:type I restriction endonuclease [Candidatus Formimonas warabiya]ATW24121.1 DNA polymerase III subunit epsilon [Candidatus Formimonas warabiya]